MKKIILLALFFVLPASSFAAVAQIIIPVTFTYGGKSITARMAVDTGASVTTIDTRLADRLGIPSDCQHGGYAQMADGRAVRYCSESMDVTASTKTRTGMEVNIMDYSANREADGMLGLDFLADMTMTIDWRNKRIYWSE
jgi:predicted aspartyl protease